jgi:hypothetical protein
MELTPKLRDIMIKTHVLALFITLLPSFELLLWHNTLYFTKQKLCILKTTILQGKTDINAEDNILLQNTSIGIDLGTTYSLISVVKQNTERVHIVKINNQNAVPSVVSYTSSGEIFVGVRALEVLIQSPSNTFSSIKRIIGKNSEAIKKETDKSIWLPRFSKKNKEEPPRLFIPALKREVTAEGISAEILKYLLRKASEYLDGEIISRAVITVPAYFDFDQRAGTHYILYMLYNIS